MGDLIETRSKKRTRNTMLIDIVIGTVAVVGILAAAVVIPNALQGLKRLGLMPKPRQREYIAVARRRAIKQGFIVEEQGMLRVTPSGRKRLESVALRMTTPTKLKRWDQKWRVLIFDIPERRRSSRLHIRTLLRSSGFIRLQDSVWVYPYPCGEYVALLKSDARVGKDLLYLVVDALDPASDTVLREHFDLPASEYMRQRARHNAQKSKNEKEQVVVKAFLDTLFGPKI